jgi:YVTN family beta-propeller protein
MPVPKKIGFLLVVTGFFLGACSEAPLIVPSGPARLNNPVAMALISPDYAVVTNANISLTQTAGSLVPVDLVNRALLMDDAVSVDSFAGNIAVDSGHSRIYIAARGDDGILVYDYSISGDSKPVSITPVNVPVPAQSVTGNGQSGVTNAVQADDNPVDVAFVPGTPAGDLILATNNISGSLSVFPTATLAPIDLNPDDDRLNGLILFSAANFTIKDSKPGRGANLIVPNPDGSLYYLTSTLKNDIYVVDPKDLKVEAMLDLSTLAATAGTRGMVIGSNNLAYVVHRALNSVLVLDVSGIKEDGIDQKVVDPRLIDIIPVGKDPEGIALSSETPLEKTLFVTNQGDNTLSVIDLTTRTTLRTTALPGRSPGRLVKDPGRNLFYILNFLSNDITLIDMTGSVVGTIQ